MSVSSKADFFRLLKKSRLLTAQQRVEAKRLCQGIQDSSVADVLVQHNFLTPWQAAQLLRGRTRFHLGKYKLLKFRGRGAMGIVFKAENPDLNRTVAVKILSNSLLGNSRSVSRFLREIRSAAALNHPNLVVAYDADEVGSTYCLVMEYVSGRSLKALCQERGRLPVLWSCECARQAALALQHVHDRGLVHRDVKPSNLLVSVRPPENRMQIKLLDVGLARFVSEVEQDGGLTRDGQIVGTGDYMAPEQVAKAKVADIRADIYGLGVTLFQLVAGVIPQAGGTLLQTYMNRLQSDPPLLSTQVPQIPPGLDSIVAKMLKRAPQERYQTPDDVASDLAAILAGTVPESLLRAASPGERAGGPHEAAGFFSPLDVVDSARSLSDVSFAVDSSSGGNGSSDTADEESITDFSRMMNDGTSDNWPRLGRASRGPSHTGRIQTLTSNTSRIVRDLIGRLARRNGSTKYPPAPAKPAPATKTRSRTKKAATVKKAATTRKAAAAKSRRKRKK